MGGRFVKLPEKAAKIAMTARKISGAELRVLLALGLHADVSGKCWPAVSTISVLTNLSERNARRALARLEKTGIITRERRKEGGRSRSTVYQLSVGEAVAGDTVAVDRVAGDTVTGGHDHHVTSDPLTMSPATAEPFTNQNGTSGPAGARADGARPSRWYPTNDQIGLAVNSTNLLRIEVLSVAQRGAFDGFDSFLAACRCHQAKLARKSSGEGVHAIAAE